MRNNLVARTAATLVAGLALALCAASPALGQTPEPPAPLERRTLRTQSVFGDNFTLRSNETIAGDLSVYGGNVTLEEGSLVEGKLNVFGGNSDIAGTVRGDLVLAGGNVRVRKSGRIEGNQTLIGGRLENDGGYVSGRSTQVPLPTVPDAPRLPPVTNNSFSPFDWYVRAVRDFFGGLVNIGLAVLAAMGALALLPRQVGQIERVMRANPLPAGGLGVLTLIAVPVIAVVLAITICMIPASALGMLALLVAVILGWSAASRFVGERIMQAVNRTGWTPLGQTAAGALGLAVFGVIPVLGGLVTFGATAAGVGAVALTRFGTQDYPAALAVGIAPVGAAAQALPVTDDPSDPQI